MNRDEYIRDVQNILDAHSGRATMQFKAAIAALPPDTETVSLDIYVDQDGEGFLGVRVGLVGPNLYVLNRAISP